MDNTLEISELLARIRNGTSSREDNKEYFKIIRGKESARIKALSEWEKRLEELLAFLPDTDDFDQRAAVSLFLSATARAAAINPGELSRQATRRI